MKWFLYNKTICNYLICGMIGIVLFLALYGFTPLNVCNDAWIMAGYDESDLIQHYAGWVQYRNSEWSFPLGLISDMAEGTGTMLSFTDSIPLVAIFCKIIEGILPDTFQYFGIYMLLCFILQSIAGYKIVRLRTEDNLWGYLGAIFFTVAPIFLERAFRHTALASHWIALFAFYVYLKSRDDRRNGIKKYYLSYLWLNVLAVCIHPYFLPMVMIFALLTGMEHSIRFRNYMQNGALFVLNLVASYVAGWLIGALGWGIESSRFGYGYFSMNLNALVNPRSLGEYDWSKLLPELAQINGNYDGFNYLGLGAILLLCIEVVLFVKKWMNTTNKKQWLLDHGLLIAAFVFLTLFAVTNVVTLNGKEILNIPIPEFLYWKCGIFRASGRIFYPVYYAIYTAGIYLLLENKDKTKLTLAALAGCMILQVADMSGMIIEKHEMMDKNATYASVLDDKVLTGAAEGHNRLVMSGVWDIVEMRRISVWAGKNDITTSYSVANSGVYAEADTLLSETLAGLEMGNLERDVIYVTQDQALYEKWLGCVDESQVIKYNYNDFYYIIPKIG